MLILLTIFATTFSGCTFFQKPPTWEEYQKGIVFPDRPERETYQGPDLSLVGQKIEPPTPIFLDEKYKPVDMSKAVIIAYSIEEHDKIVEALKRKKFAEDTVRLLDTNNKLKYEIIQDLKQELWLTEKRAALEGWMRKVDQINYEKDITYYKVKDVILGLGSVAIFVLSVMP